LTMIMVNCTNSLVCVREKKCVFVCKKVVERERERERERTRERERERE